MYSQWQSTMQRFIHRTDIEPDLETVWMLASGNFHKSWLKAGTELLFSDRDELLKAAGRPLHHAGLMVLHELAQDDAGLLRETQLFADAMQDFVHWWSINNVSPDPLNQGVTNAG